MLPALHALLSTFSAAPLRLLIIDVVPVAVPAALFMSVVIVHILFDSEQFVVRNTGQTGPVDDGGGFGQSVYAVSLVARHRPSLLKYLAGGAGGGGGGGTHGPSAAPVGPHAPGTTASSAVQKGAAQVTLSS
jgi:hypothetical protein